MKLTEAFVAKYENLLGDEAAPFFESLTEGQPRSSFRLNPAKPNADWALKNYGPDNIEAIPQIDQAYFGPVDGKSPLHQAGYQYSQEASAMLVAQVADVKPGQRVLDLCAAPGGKSTQLATAMEGEGLLVSNEIVPKRARILSENMERWGVRNALVTNESPDSLAKHFPSYFDQIVVDAPCSGEGMFRKNPQAVAEWTSDSPSFCAARQEGILEEALKMLRPGGYLTYSTCTFAPKENEQVVAWLLDQYPLRLVPLELEGADQGRPDWVPGNAEEVAGCLRLWPHRSFGEGHFIAKFELLEPVGKKDSVKPFKPGKLSKEETDLFGDFQRAFPLPFPGQLALFKNHLWLLPEDCPDLSGLKVLRQGLHLGEFLKKRFEPSFAWAMAVEDLAGQRILPISYAEWVKYVGGESLPKDAEDGWALLCLDGKMPVGFGKAAKGTVKNFYPKGLRFQV